MHKFQSMHAHACVCVGGGLCVSVCSCMCVLLVPLQSALYSHPMWLMGAIQILFIIIIITDKANPLLTTCHVTPSTCYYSPLLTPGHVTPSTCCSGPPLTPGHATLSTCCSNSLLTPGHATPSTCCSSSPLTPGQYLLFQTIHSLHDAVGHLLLLLVQLPDGVKAGTHVGAQLADS